MLRSVFGRSLPAIINSFERVKLAFGSRKSAFKQCANTCSMRLDLRQTKSLVAGFNYRFVCLRFAFEIESRKAEHCSFAAITMLDFASDPKSSGKVAALIERLYEMQFVLFCAPANCQRCCLFRLARCNWISLDLFLSRAAHFGGRLHAQLANPIANCPTG